MAARIIAVGGFLPTGTAGGALQAAVVAAPSFGWLVAFMLRYALLKAL